MAIKGRTVVVTITKTTRLSVTQAVSVTGWTVTVGVVKVGVVDTHYGVSQPGADAEQ